MAKRLTTIVEKLNELHYQHIGKQARKARACYLHIVLMQPINYQSSELCRIDLAMISVAMKNFVASNLKGGIGRNTVLYLCSRSNLVIG